MKGWRYIFWFFIWGTMISGTHAQTFGEDALSPTGNKITKGFQPHINVSVGIAFHSLRYGNTFFSTYLYPQITLPVNRKFSMETGVSYSTLFAQTGKSTPQHYGTVYFKGRYKLNGQLTLTAAGYKTFNLQPATKQERLNPHALDFSNQGIRIDLNYKVNDKFEINAAFSYDKRSYNPYLFSPFQNGYGNYMPAFSRFGY